MSPLRTAPRNAAASPQERRFRSLEDDRNTERAVSKRRRGQAIVLILIACLLAIRVWDPLPVASLRERSFDVLQQVLSNGILSEDIVIVEIDEESLARIGQWPWPRDRLADLTTRLAGLGARVVGFDMILAEPDRFTGTVPAAPGQTPGPIPAAATPAPADPWGPFFAA